MRTKLAKASPFSGTPFIMSPEIYGSSPQKPFMWRIPITGERPVKLYVNNLPEPLSLNENIISGIAPDEGEYEITLTAENSLGKHVKNVCILITQDGLLKTPLLGFTTWNAFADKVTQSDVELTARQLVEMGIAEYGYSYVNLDSSWQGEYGGKYDAIQPNAKFSDMKSMYSYIHSLGLKGGIYSTPFLHAWGCPADMEYLPGCTRGTADIRFTENNTGIGTEHLENENVSQWCEWGVDYLKYDWSPTDTINADIMKKALQKADRDIAFCVTVLASSEYAAYWRKNCNSWRCNNDTFDIWENVCVRFDTLEKWRGKTEPGHFYDLDMLAIGPMIMNGGKCRLTNEEELSAYTLHAFCPSPIQISMLLNYITEFEFDLICNEEMIAINQDVQCSYPELLVKDDLYRIYKRQLSNGDIALAIFNLSDTPLEGETELEKSYKIRNVWEKQFCQSGTSLHYTLDAHEAAVFRLS